MLYFLLISYLNTFQDRRYVKTVNTFFLWQGNSTMDVVFGFEIAKGTRNVTSTADLKCRSRQRRESAVCVRVDQRIVSVSGRCTYIPILGCRSEPDSGTRATYRPTSVPCAVLGSRRVNGSNVGPFEVDKVVS